MPRSPITLFACLLAVPLLGVVQPPAAGADEPTWQRHPSKNKPRAHVMVQFTDSSLHPSIAQVLPDGRVSFVNYASHYDGSIVFGDAMAKAFACETLRPNWLKTAAGYQSIPVSMGGGTDDLALPCPLAPGEYMYEIWLIEPRPGGAANLSEPRARLQGKIVVD